MKQLIISCVLGLVFFSCKQTANMEGIGKSYGPATVVIANVISVENMLRDYTTKTAPADYTLQGKIVEVCSNAGCWITLDKGNGELLMVRFKDHFTIPVKTKPGTEVYLHGIAYQDTVSVELLRHFAEDARKSQEEIDKITEPLFRLEFEADGIVVKKK